MAYVQRALSPAVVRGLAALTASLMLGGCAQTGDLLSKGDVAMLSDSEDAEKDDGTQTELQKATTYWGKEFAKKPAELKPALNYARNLKALGEKQKALNVLQQASALHDGDPELAGEYGRLALELDQINIASRMLEIADNPAKPDWKVISARGTIFSKQGKYKEAIPYYQRALTLAPNQPSVLNNLAMAHAMSGDAKTAEGMLRQASAEQGATPKVKENLALVLGLQGRYDEAKALSGTTLTAEAASANADLMRQMVKIDPKSAPIALANAPVGDFKTQVTKAIATAPATSAGTVAKAATATPATPAAVTFKPATAETAAVAATAIWQGQTADSDTKPALFKGSSQ